MFCPNCGLANPDTAKFCANCGTRFGDAVAPQPVPPPSQAPPSYSPQPPIGRGNTTAKNIGIGCLIAVVIFLFFGLSCTRACLGLHRRTYIHRRY